MNRMENTRFKINNNSMFYLHPSQDAQLLFFKYKEFSSHRMTICQWGDNSFLTVISHNYFHHCQLMTSSGMWLSGEIEISAKQNAKQLIYSKITLSRSRMNHRPDLRLRSNITPCLVRPPLSLELRYNLGRINQTRVYIHPCKQHHWQPLATITQVGSNWNAVKYYWWKKPSQWVI